MSTGGAAVLAWTGATTTMVAALALLCTVLLAQAQAETAADLASLAAADALAIASPAPCSIAAEVASRNGARLSDCAVDGEDVRVRVEVDASPLPPVGARSRAGPGPVELGDVGPDAEAPP